MSQQRASSQPRETYSKLFVGDFRRDVPAPGHAYFGLCSSFRAMVFPRPGGPCLCWHSSSSSSSRCRPSVAWCFLAGSRLFEGSAAAAAAPSSRHRETYSKLFLGDFRRDVPAPGNVYFGLHSSFRAMVFPRPGGPCLCGHSSSSSSSSCFLLWKLFDCSSTTAAPQQQQQAAAGSSRQQQASVGSSRHKQTQQ